MIKIIKEGIKEFGAMCPFCHCEFTYEKEDLDNGTVSCPCCGALLDAKPHTKDIIRDNMVYETPEYRKLQEALKQQPSYVNCAEPPSPCENCPHNLRLRLGETYVGDSPCQWCQHSGLQITCASTAQT